VSAAKTTELVVADPQFRLSIINRVGPQLQRRHLSFERLGQLWGLEHARAFERRVPAEPAFMRMTSSLRFVRKPEATEWQNGSSERRAERFIRTLKENLLWIEHFTTVAELVEALRDFKRRYNEQWLIGRHGYRTPSQVRGS
jgi:hypothetical protein